MYWILDLSKNTKASANQTGATLGHQSAGRASGLAGSHWILGHPRCGLVPGLGIQRIYGPDFPSSLSGSRSSSGRSLLPLSPGAAAPCRGWHGLDESLGLSVVSHSRSRIDPGTSETLYLSVRSIHSHDPAGREGHRRNPDFCPGNPGISRENVFGRPSDLRQLVSASPCAFGAGPNSVSAGSMLRPVDPGHLTGCRSDAPARRSCPGRVL